MRTNNLRLESGQEYSLKQLFNGNNRIVIPDLQRDYCWGDKAWNKDAQKHTELVSGFMDSLISSFNEKPRPRLTLGLIYGYENPHFNIQLCDGQQRITTLFLLLGMINRRLLGVINPNIENDFQRLLITDAELEDDKEPNLQYAIRESTLYFLSDLVCEFFLKKDVAIEDIKKKEWYFKEYDLDASIQSMICALQKIELKLSEIDNYKDFGNFIVNNLQMLYYDMGHRTRGEETFVIINTTGEPLTATENLKPLLLGSLDNKVIKFRNDRDEQNKETELQYYSRQWEDREEWFWQNRRSKEQTSDSALNEFFIWYWQINLLQEKSWKKNTPPSLNPNALFLKKPQIFEGQEENPNIEKWEESKNLDTVQSYFFALKKLVEVSQEEKTAKVLKTTQDKDIKLSWFRNSKLDIVLPLLAYLEKFEYTEQFYEFVRRIRKNYYDKERIEREKNHIDWRYIIQIIKFSEKEEDVLVYKTLLNKDKFNKIPNVELNEWYNQDEERKYFLKKDHKREVEQWEDHDELYGDLSVLWSVNGEDDLDYNKISQYFQSFETLSNCLIEKKSIRNPILSNYFRLYKLLIGYPAIGHIDYCSSDMEGAWFSWRNVNSTNFSKYLFDEKIISLIRLSIPQLIDELENRIKYIVKEKSLIEINDDNFNVAKHLQAWLLIKVLYINSKNQLLGFYDGSGIASYKNCKQNKLNDHLEFSLANSICGYVIKNPANRIDYAGREYWGKIFAIDSILDESISYNEFKNRKEILISKEKIENIETSINRLINSFLDD